MEKFQQYEELNSKLMNSNKFKNVIQSIQSILASLGIKKTDLTIQDYSKLLIFETLGLEKGTLSKENCLRILDNKKTEIKLFVPDKGLEALGVDKNTLEKDYIKLLTGQKTEMMPFSIPYTKEKEDLLKRENIEYSYKGNEKENGLLKFDGKIKIDPAFMVENTQDNVNLLKKANIEFDKMPDTKALKLKDTLALTALLINPGMGLVLGVYYVAKVIPQRRGVKNELGLTKEQISDLKKGDSVKHKIGNNTYIMQLDKETNSIVSVKKDQLNIPDRMFGQELSQRDKAKLASGFSFQLDNGISVQLDLNKRNGVKYTNSNGHEISYKEVVQYQDSRTQARSNSIKM